MVEWDMTSQKGARSNWLSPDKFKKEKTILDSTEAENLLESQKDGNHLSVCNYLFPFCWDNQNLLEKQWTIKHQVPEEARIRCA